MAALDSSDDWMDLTQMHLNWTELKELYQILLRLGKRHKQKTEKEQQQG